MEYRKALVDPITVTERGETGTRAETKYPVEYADGGIMHETNYLSKPERSERNAKIRVIQNRDSRLGEVGMAGELLNILLDDQIKRIGDIGSVDFTQPGGRSRHH